MILSNKGFGRLVIKVFIIYGSTYAKIWSWWEVLMWFDNEVAARVSGVAETVDYFG